MFVYKILSPNAILKFHLKFDFSIMRYFISFNYNGPSLTILNPLVFPVLGFSFLFFSFLFFSILDYTILCFTMLY
jgi:hypothetical protein